MLLQWTPPGKVAERFFNSYRYEMYLAGPFASGKTDTWIKHFFRRLCGQRPDEKGVRRSEVIIFRKGYIALSAVVKDMEAILKGFGTIYKSSNHLNGIHGIYKFNLADGTSVDALVLFMTTDSPNFIDKVKGRNSTFCIGDEINENPEEIVEMVLDRCNRFPIINGKKAATYPGLIGMFNLTDKDHWVYRKTMLDPDYKDYIIHNPDGTTRIETRRYKEFFLQPGGFTCTNMQDVLLRGADPQYVVNFEAENLKVLGEDYYQNKIEKHPTAERFRRLMAVYACQWIGTSKGKCVFEKDFDYDAHVSKEKLEPNAAYPLIIGFDTSGFNPCICITQFIDGGLRVYETVWGDNVSFYKFISDYIKPTLTNRYRGINDIVFCCDPANARSQASGQTPIDMLQENGFMAIPARTNNFSERIEAVAQFMAKRNGFLVNRDATVLLKGLTETYQYDEDGRGGYKDRPNKRLDISHFMDSLQYAALYASMSGTSLHKVPDTVLFSTKRKMFL